MVKVGVVGNREDWSYETVKKKLEALKIDYTYTLISGGAQGVDSFAERYAKEKGCTIVIHHPNPNLAAGEKYFARNKKIADECDWLVAFDKKAGASGTKNTIAYAKRANKAIFLYRDDGDCN